MNAENLKKAREIAGLTQAEAAKSLGVSDGTYKNYEQGKREPNNTLLCEIADLYGVTADFLLGREKQISPFTGVPPVDDDEFIRLYTELPDLAKEVFIDVLAKLAQAQKSKSKKVPPKADSAPQLFIAASDGNPVTKMDKGVIDRLKNAKPIDDDF